MDPTPATEFEPGRTKKFRESKLLRVLSYRDFRILWIGAFVSFTGGWMQTVAQGYFVYSLTNDESKLAFVSFCASFPIFLFGFVAGSFADHFDKRKVLIVTQALFAAGPIFLAFATYYHFVQYWHIVACALLLGAVGCVEMPVRQSVISRVVPPEDLAAAVPVNAMTFNTARIFGPAFGAIVLATVGVAACYLINGLSFLALIWSAARIKSDLSPRPSAPQPIRDVIFEGMLYTFRDVRLRTLFILETLTACFGIVYVPLLPAFVHQILGFGDEIVMVNGHRELIDTSKAANGHCYTAIGIGAIVGLLVVTQISDRPYKATIIRLSMWIIAASLSLLSFAHNVWFAYVLLALLGMAVVAQFNTTNTLFQILSPERIRGRVLSMHIWGLNGLSPFGTLLYGWIASTTRRNDYLPIANFKVPVPSTGVALSIQLAAIIVFIGAIAATVSKRGLSRLEETASEHAI